MKAIRSVFVLATALSAYAQLPGQMAPPKPTTTKPVDLHTSQNSLDWAGVLRGSFALRRLSRHQDQADAQPRRHLRTRNAVSGTAGCGGDRDEGDSHGRQVATPLLSMSMAVGNSIPLARGACRCSTSWRLEVTPGWC